MKSNTKDEEDLPQLKQLLTDTINNFIKDLDFFKLPPNERDVNYLEANVFLSDPNRRIFHLTHYYAIRKQVASVLEALDLILVKIGDQKPKRKKWNRVSLFSILPDARRRRIE